MSTQATGAAQKSSLGDGFRTALGIGGLIAVVLGLLIIFFPAKSGAVTMQIVAAVTAAYALVVGVVYLGTALFGRGIGGWARTGHIVLGLLYVIGGVVMLVNLGATAALLTIFLSVTVGVLWLFEGVLAFTTLKQAPNRVWGIIHGVISVLAGLTLILSPLLGAVTLWLLLGISMLVLGIVQAVRAFGMKTV
ncbi:HdeD family acid-resistance protein [Leucobacter sp. NPDC058333]|uniref:HdeD family acid-resistance protein n=1 Tax=Leucobacter sp. NPDC058333 TaxID=3346450 RepID=UPI00364DC92C